MVSSAIEVNNPLIMADLYMNYWGMTEYKSKLPDEILKIKNTLGSKFVGLFDSCIPHSPLENVIDCANSVQQNNPDIIITIGGGTPIDTVKAVSYTHLTLPTKA